MPYTYKKQGSKYCVYKKNTGEKVGCTDGKKEALRKYLAALHIHEDQVQEEQVRNTKFAPSYIEFLNNK